MQNALKPVVTMLTFAILLQPARSAEPTLDDKSTTEASGVAESFTVLASETYRSINAALTRKTYGGVDEVPLYLLMQSFADDFNIPIRIDNEELENQEINPAAPVTLSHEQMTLRSALDLILSPLKLDFVYRDEVLCITSRSAVKATPITLLYEISTPYSDNDVAALLERTAESMSDNESPKPIVQLLSRSDAANPKRHLFVRANKHTHDEVQTTLKLLNCRSSN